MVEKSLIDVERKSDGLQKGILLVTCGTHMNESRHMDESCHI